MPKEREMSMIKVPTDNRGSTATVNLDHIAFVSKESKADGGGALIHLGVRCLGMERRVRLAVVRTTVSKERVDELIRSAGALVVDSKPEYLYGRGNR
jgi:hypothetical protein